MRRFGGVRAWFGILVSTSVLLAGCGGSDDGTTAIPGLQAGRWANAKVGDVHEVKLSDLNPTQGGPDFDQIYYKLGRYELDPTKKFDDFCADEGQTGVVCSTSVSKLSDATSFTCAVTDSAKRDTSVLGTVVVGPNGDSLYLTDGHHGFTTYYEVSDGGPSLKVHVLVKNNLAPYSGSAFWNQMSRNNYVWLKDGNDTAIATDKLPAALGLHNGLQNDVYRSLVYFTRDVGYSKPTLSTEFLEFYWAEWFRAQRSFSLGDYDLGKLNAVTDPAADKGYLGAVWNASVLMVAAGDPIIADKTGAILGKLASINSGKAYSKGSFGDLSKPISATKPGKIAYLLSYRTAHGL